VIAFWASFFDYHFAFSSALSEASACLVFMEPVFIFADCELGLDDFAWVGVGVPANYLKLSSLPQIWQWMLASIV